MSIKTMFKRIHFSAYDTLHNSLIFSTLKLRNLVTLSWTTAVGQRHRPYGSIPNISTLKIRALQLSKYQYYQPTRRYNPTDMPSKAVDLSLPFRRKLHIFRRISEQQR
jgi:hypothetical protein